MTLPSRTRQESKSLHRQGRSDRKIDASLALTNTSEHVSIGYHDPSTPAFARVIITISMTRVCRDSHRYFKRTPDEMTGPNK
ncbi:hypothetical protein E4U21_005902 [Claviceps maximensis]|nr:hypothetical protein E4U21_005902 [Claviceps maximensis]